MHDDVVALRNDELMFVTQRIGCVPDQIEQSVATRFNVRGMAMQSAGGASSDQYVESRKWCCARGRSVSLKVTVPRQSMKQTRVAKGDVTPAGERFCKILQRLIGTLQALCGGPK